MTTIKSLIKTTMTPIALCLTLAIATPVIAKKGHHQKDDGMRQIFSELSLSDIQKQDIRQIFKENKENRRVYSADDKSLRQELRSLIQSTDWDKTIVNNILTQLHALKQTKDLQRASNRNLVWNTLTTAQQEKFIVLAEAQEPKRKKGNSKGRGKDKRLKGLDLSEEQLTIINTIKADSKLAVEEIKTTIKTYKQAERSLIQSATFDSDAWQALGTKYQASFLTMAEMRAQSKHQIWNTLTSEQQAKFIAKMTKRNHKKGNKTI